MGKTFHSLIFIYFLNKTPKSGKILLKMDPRQLAHPSSIRTGSDQKNQKRFMKTILSKNQYFRAEVGRTCELPTTRTTKDHEFFRSCRFKQKINHV
jgi:hypothetical protein